MPTQNGTPGDDTLTGTGGADIINGLDGNDTITGLGQSDELNGDAGNDTIYGGDARDTINGGDGDDILYGDFGDDLIFGGDGNDSLYGETGNDDLDGGAGNDLLSSGGSVAGFSYPDETFYGREGDDILIGGSTAMYGGPGDDIFYVNMDGTLYVGDFNYYWPADRVFEAAGEGFDIVYSRVKFTLEEGQEVEILTYNPAGGAGTLTGNSGANTILGNANGNLLVGKGGNDLLKGNGGNDTLQGGDGDDYLVGGTGADEMEGGAGSDTYYVDDAGDMIIEPVLVGVDRVAASVSYALAAAADIESLEAVNLGATDAMDLFGNQFGQTIIGNDGVNILKGNGADDVLIGLGGDDFLVGGTQIDTMYGGLGNDTYYVDAAGDVVSEAAGEGTDRVAASASYVLLAGAEIEFLEAVTPSATDAMDLTGNDFNQVIRGNNGVNILRGNGGSDTLSGYGGDDYLVGGTGDDRMEGSLGNDTYYVDSAGDVVTELAGEGTDRIAASASYTLAEGTEVERLEAVNLAATNGMDFTGNSLGQTLVGNNGINWLDGKGGADVLVGLGGADTFYFSTAPGGANVDTIADFVSGTDYIALDDGVFSGLALGNPPASVFVIGTQAGDANDRLIYNSATGALFYDADGTGPVAMVQFATIYGAPPVAASDFIIV